MVALYDRNTQRTLTYVVRGNIIVRLTSCLTGLESAVLLNWNYKQMCLFGQILTGQTGGQAYSNISPYEVSECSLFQPSNKFGDYPLLTIAIVINATAYHLGPADTSLLSFNPTLLSIVWSINPTVYLSAANPGACIVLVQLLVKNRCYS